MPFEWDDAKARANKAKHGVLFDEAATVFADAPRTFVDSSHSGNEVRYSVIGWSDRSRLLLVIVTERAGNLRIISARPATKAEARKYGQT